MIPPALELALRERFAAPEWALFFEVRNGTGFDRAARSADAIAMSLWPSRGLEFYGFEVKRSRADWLRELKDPAKAEAIAAYCDRWWIVVDDRAIVKDGELPATWGLLALHGKALRCEREATLLTPKPFDRLFVAALLRSAQKASPGDALVKAAVDAARVEMQKMHSAALEEWRDRLRDTQSRHEKLLADFEEASGVDLRERWADPKKIGAAVRVVLEGQTRVAEIRRELSDLAEKAERIGLATRAILETKLDGGQSE